jgi:hypothetical protein
MMPEPASSVVMAASASRVRRKAIPGTGKAVRSSEAICPPMIRTFWSAAITVISASDRSDSSSAYAVATSSTRRLIPTVAPVVLALGAGRWLSRRPRRVTGVDPMLQ